jgi:hypothetical protein
MQIDWLTPFAIYSVQTQSTCSSIRTHPKTRGGASLKVLALLLSLIYVSFFFFFLVFSFVYCVYINAIEFCYWSYYPCCYCDTFCYLLCAYTKYYLQHAYTSQNQRWCQSKGTSIVIIIDFLVFFFII